MLSKTYNPTEHEDTIYKLWDESGYFNPDNLPSDHTEPFAVMMPPPNVTGVLHLGHALENSIMDIEVRYQRLRGKKVLLVPGTDHAALPTQARVEDNLKKAGMVNPRQELGREGLLKEIRAYADQSRATILGQIRKLGTSADWSRLAYTFDEPRSKAVNAIFKKMYEDGLIYRGYRVVNWSVTGQSTASDDEVVYTERMTTLYTLKYSKDFPITIATVLPETKLGDTAVAVHPDDTRYQAYIGKTFNLEMGGKSLSIKVVGDTNVDPNYGTGALGVTPAHSHIDYDIAQKNDLPVIQIIGQDGYMTAEAGQFAGLPVKQAREQFVQWLRDNGLMISEQEITHNVSLSDRFKDEIWPMPMEQWFVDVNKTIPGKNKSLKQLMREAVTTGHNGDASQVIQITPDRFQPVYLHWIDNLHDWCISRQIWWGHRIPAYYNINDSKNSDGGIKIQNFTKKTGISHSDIEKFENTENIELDGTFLYQKQSNNILDASMDFQYASNLIKYGFITATKLIEAADSFTFNECKKPEIFNDDSEIPEGYIQDPDTLDTWFSSGMWTFSTLGWPNDTADFKTFYPTAWMQMGYEILFLWMARMILFSTYALDTIPFRQVYIHGILRDKAGRKFSKSLGNGIDPLVVIKQYGADALRWSVIKGIAPGNDARFYEEKVADARNFVTKIWNLSRFVLAQTEDGTTNEETTLGLSLADQWIISRLNHTVTTVTAQLDTYQFSQAAETIYDFVWNEFANWYVEIKKFEPNLTLTKQVLETSIKLLHPFIPFVTEALWQELHPGEILMVAKWPRPVGQRDEAIEQQFTELQEVIIQLRNIRAQYKISYQQPITLFTATALAPAEQSMIENFVKVNITVGKATGQVTTVSTSRFMFELDLSQLIDVTAEQKRLQKEITVLEKNVASFETKLNNPDFVNKVPAAVLENTKKLHQEKLKLLEDNKKALAQLG